MIRTMSLFTLLTLSIPTLLAVACNSKPSSALQDSSDREPVQPSLDAAPINPSLKKYFRTPADYARVTALQLTPSMIKEDSEYLANMLVATYAGGSGVDQPQVAWDSLFQAIGNEAQALSGQEWASVIRETMRKHGPRDSHLAIFSILPDGRMGYSQTVFPAAARFEADPSCAAAAAYERPYYDHGLQRMTRRAIIVADEQPRAGNCNWQRSEKSNDAFAPEPSVRYADSQIQILAMHSFNYHDDLGWQRFHAAWSALPDTKNLVIDMRANRGGDHYEFYAWLAQAIGRTPAPYRFQVKDSGLQSVVTYNSCSKGIFESGVVSPYCKEFMSQLLANIPPEAGVSDAISFSWLMQSQAELDPHLFDKTMKKPFQGRFIILVDRACGSACELALKTLKHENRTLVVGEQTAGMALYDLNNVHILPGSGLRMVFGNAIEREFLDGAFGFKEGYGIMPDIWLDPNALESDADIVSLVNAIDQAALK